MTVDGDHFAFGHDADGGLTRRAILTRGVQAVSAATVVGSLLAACGGSSPSNTGGSVTTTSGPHGLTALPGGTPKRGGTFTVGTISNGTAETLFPGASYSNPDFARIYALFEPLFYPGVNVHPLVPALALSAEPNSDATKWIFHLRDGVTWHDGKPFTAEDVVYNFQSVWSQPTSANHYALAGITDFQGVRAVGKLDVEVPLLSPVAQYPTLFAFYGSLIIQKGSTAKSVNTNPIGTGPFKYESFTPGQRSVFKANPNYWQQGKPYVDEMIVNSSFTDATALFNALLGGQVNLLPGAPFDQARAQLSSKQVQILESPASGQTFGFCMRSDVAPYSDNRVRTAFKTLVDRQAMIKGALSGFGVPIYDMPGYGSEYYATDLKREVDVEKAKSLFKAAGVLGHTFTLQTGEAFAGQVESATILAQQAAAAGVTVNVQKISPVTYFGPSGGFLKRPFGQEVNESNASLTGVYRAELVKGCPYPDTRWCSGPQANQRNAVIQAAIAELNPTKAKEKWHVAQEAQFNEGGYLWWTAFPFVDAAANNIRGLSAGAGFNYNNWQLQDGWIE